MDFFVTTVCNNINWCPPEIDTDEIESHTENFAEETVEFLVDVEEIVIEDE